MLVGAPTTALYVLVTVLFHFTSVPCLRVWIRKLGHLRGEERRSHEFTDGHLKNQLQLSSLFFLGPLGLILIRESPVLDGRDVTETSQYGSAKKRVSYRELASVL